MSIALIERAVFALGPLTEQLVFVGGATLGLWITDEAAAPIRATVDVDTVVEVASREALEQIHRALRARNFTEDKDSGVICRWEHGSVAGPLILDVMPTDPSVLGFSTRWHEIAARNAVERTLPSGARVRAARPEHLVAMKLEAFDSRGQADFLGSHDLEDVVSLIDGRDALAQEIAAADDPSRAHIAERVARLLVDSRFLEALPGHLAADAASQARAHSVVLPRLRAVAGLLVD